MSPLEVPPLRKDVDPMLDGAGATELEAGTATGVLLTTEEEEHAFWRGV